MRTCTVVIPAYIPDLDVLHRSLARLLLMPEAAHIVVVDDGSDPPLRDEDAPLSAQRVTLLRQENAGVSSARNAGIEHALRRDDPVVFLDADDEPRPGLAHALEMLERTGASAVVSAREERRPDGHETIKPIPPDWAGATLEHPSDVFRPIALFGASGIAVDRRALRSGLRFDPSLSHAEDRDFLRRAGEVGPIALNPQPALLVRLHPDDASNLTSSAHDMRRAKALVTLVERWNDARAEPHFRAGARWLLSRIAKRRSAPEAWDTLIDLHRARRWPIPLKTRLRRLLQPGR